MKDTPADIFLLKLNKRNIRTKCEICSKLVIKTPEQRQWRSGIFIVNFEHILQLVLVSPLLTLNMELLAGMNPCASSAYIFGLVVYYMRILFL